MKEIYKVLIESVSLIYNFSHLYEQLPALRIQYGWEFLVVCLPDTFSPLPGYWLSDAGDLLNKNSSGQEI